MPKQDYQPLRLNTRTSNPCIEAMVLKALFLYFILRLHSSIHFSGIIHCSCFLFGSCIQELFQVWYSKLTFLSQILHSKLIFKTNTRLILSLQHYPKLIIRAYILRLFPSLLSIYAFRDYP
jgi:hypothetical protein